MGRRNRATPPPPPAGQYIIAVITPHGPRFASRNTRGRDGTLTKLRDQCRLFTADEARAWITRHGHDGLATATRYDDGGD